MRDARTPSMMCLRERPFWFGSVLPVPKKLHGQEGQRTLCSRYSGEHVHLGRNNELVAVNLELLEDTAHLDLGLAVGVDLGIVEEVHAVVKGGLDQILDLCFRTSRMRRGENTGSGAMFGGLRGRKNARGRP